MIDKTVIELENLVNTGVNGRKLSKAIRKTIRHLADDIGKHEGEFLGDVLERHPYWFRRVNGLAKDYLQLLEDLGFIIYEKGRKEKVLHWLNRFRKCRSHENCLLLDSFNVEFGSDP